MSLISLPPPCTSSSFRHRHAAHQPAAPQTCVNSLTTQQWQCHWQRRCNREPVRNDVLALVITQQYMHRCTAVSRPSSGGAPLPGGTWGRHCGSFLGGPSSEHRKPPAAAAATAAGVSRHSVPHWGGSRAPSPNRSSHGRCTDCTTVLPGQTVWGRGHAASG